MLERLGLQHPIVQAPMGWIARSPLAAAVSRAGALGIVETSSGELDAIRVEIRRMREITDRPFGVNIAQAFVRDPAIHVRVCEAASAWVGSKGWTIRGIEKSPITGPEGNVEFLLGATKGASDDDAQ